MGATSVLREVERYRRIPATCGLQPGREKHKIQILETLPHIQAQRQRTSYIFFWTWCAHSHIQINQ